MSTAPARPATRAEELRSHVTRRVEELQRAYVDPTHHQNSWATGVLAHLRRSVGSAPGAHPAVWQLVHDGLPARFVGGEDPSRSGAAVPSSAERAIHAAFVLYAVHQQSRREPMHLRGRGFGRAVRDLAGRTQAEAAVLRRFHALGTAQGLDEVLHHGRGLVTQLRAESVPLDHGQLAVDLELLQHSASADGVRLRWGRDYYARPSRAVDEPATASASRPTEDTTQHHDQEEAR